MIHTDDAKSSLRVALLWRPSRSRNERWLISVFDMRVNHQRPAFLCQHQYLRFVRIRDWWTAANSAYYLLATIARQRLKICASSKSANSDTYQLKRCGTPRTWYEYSVDVLCISKFRTYRTLFPLWQTNTAGGDHHCLSLTAPWGSLKIYCELICYRWQSISVDHGILAPRLKELLKAVKPLRRKYVCDLCG